MYDSPRAMAKLLKEAKRLKKVLSANTDHISQVVCVCVYVCVCVCAYICCVFSLLLSLHIAITTLMCISRVYFHFISFFFSSLLYVSFLLQVEGLLDDVDFSAVVKREEFEGLCEDLFDRIAAPVTQALKSADMTMVVYQMLTSSCLVLTFYSLLGGDRFSDTYRRGH